MGELRAVLWDVDGTLADTERDGHRVAFNAAFADLGLAWHWDESLYGSLLQVTGGKERINYFLDNHPQQTLAGDRQQLIAEIHQLKTRYFQTMLASGQIPLRPGVKTLVYQAAEQGIAQAIATTTTEDNVRQLIEVNFGEDAQRLFQVIAAGDIVRAKKPAPDIYTWALGRLALSPDASIAIEDSQNGLLSARAAGIRTVVVTLNGYTREDDLTSASVILDSLGEPDQPCSLIAGDLAPEHCVDIAYLRRLHDNSHR